MTKKNDLFGLRRVQYRYLSALIGKKVEIPDLTQVEGPLLAVASTVIKGSFKLQDSTKDLTVVMWKHGFLDVTFKSSVVG